jgi:abequosyltransferase
MGVRRDNGLCRRTFDMSVGIPAYARCRELIELLESIYEQTVLPAEITICEDKSADRESIRLIVQEWRERFTAEGCTVNYKENDHNLGYDGNLRNVISASHFPWVMLIGNDDLLLEGCVERAERFIRKNDKIKMISRSFLRFENDIQKPVGVSRLSSTDQIFNSVNSSTKMIVRTSGFVSGLIVNREWALNIATDRYDGTLFYQIYLASVAFCDGGIGYIAQPVVGGRCSNPPLFGSATWEKDVHVPGSYTPRGRAKMWASILRIASDVGQQYKIDLYAGIKAKLEVRSSFHVFEMMAGSDRRKLSELRHELTKLDLFSHPIPRTLYLIDWVLGSRAKVFYAFVRRALQ